MARTFSIQGMSDEDVILLLNLQGIVNRDGARLLYDTEGRSDWGPSDRLWMRIWHERKGFGFDAVESLDALVRTFAEHIKGVVVYDPELDDVYYYGIQRPVHASGLLCERVDQEVFTGDILARIRERIKSAAVVIAEMTGGNPNVYLELGYAWGVGRPTVLLAKGVEHLRFDVQGQRCLVYGKIKELEDRLGTELEALKAKGIF